MAPNRNDLNSSLHALRSLDLSEHFQTTSKYALLVPQTLSSEEAAIAVSCATIESNIVASSKSLNSASTISNDDAQGYWDMPADEDKDYFSADYLEKMLTNDAARRQEENETETIAPTTSSTESYWDWSEESSAAEEPQSKSSLVEAIMKSERIRLMLTCENIAKYEQTHQETRSSPQIKPTHCNSMHDSDSYFYQPPYQEEKEVIISRILREEEQRQVLLTETILKQLVLQRDARSGEESKEEFIDTASGDANVSYWEW
jgi:excinuclease UvrABC ATPase subunit